MDTTGTSPDRDSPGLRLTADRILEGISDAFVALSPDWVYLYVNHQAGRLFGRSPEDLLGRHIWQEFPEAVGQPFHRAYERAMRGGPPIFLEEYMAPWDRWFENRIHPLPGGGIGIFFHEITERKRTETALERERQAHLDSLALLDTLITAAPVGLAFVDTEQRYVRVNPELARMNGLPVEQHLGRTVVELVPELGGVPERLLRSVLDTREPVVDVEVTGRTAADRDDAEVHHWLASYYPVQPAGGAVVGAGIVVRDVTAERRSAALLARQATHDELTGLPNRALLLTRLTELLTRPRERHVAVLFIDLDQFKVVNDSLGHGAGDDLLRQVGRRLARVLGTPDGVARLGGDEFVVLSEVADEKEAVHLAGRVLEALGDAFDGEPALNVGCSIGVVLAAPGEGDAEGLLRDADLAMYGAKAAGRRQVRLFDAQLRERAVARHSLEHRLREALQDPAGLTVHYQPVVRLSTGRVVAVEALARWTDDRLGPVTPDRFIPVAEDSGLIVPLGHHVLVSACRQAAQWRVTLGAAAPQVAVNLSPHQLLTGAALVTQVRAALDAHGLPASALCLEITESSVVAETTAAHTAVTALADLGVDIALDDFGTGFSSLSYLTSLPVTTVKVDRSHVSRLDTDPRCLQVVCGVVGLARGLGMRTVAEGAETAEQVRTLRDLGCDDIQGWVVSRALPADALTPLLRDGALGSRLGDGA